MYSMIGAEALMNLLISLSAESSVAKRGFRAQTHDHNLQKKVKEFGTHEFRLVWRAAVPLKEEHTSQLRQQFSQPRCGRGHTFLHKPTTQLLSNSDHCNGKKVILLGMDESCLLLSKYRRISTYSEERKFWNRVAMRSMPCLTLRSWRERLPCVLTVSFFIS